MTSFTPVDLEVIRAVPVTLRVANPTKNGAAVDMTSATIRFVAKWRNEDADASAVFTRATGGNGITTTSTTIDVAFVAANFSTVPYAKVTLEYELCWLNGSTIYEVIMKGKLIVHPNTNRT
jgi:hypothetical protein